MSYDAVKLLTIGHSTRALTDFISLLEKNGVVTLVDVRTIPRSRHNPQFNKDTLPGALAEHSISYIHLASLGGLRKPVEGSINTAWRNASFRGYADYMQTSGFESGLAELLEIAARGQTAIMCAEAVPWRCHRSLIADALTARKIRVEHIVGGGETIEHKLTKWARVDGWRVYYPLAQQRLI